MRVRYRVPEDSAVAFSQFRLDPWVNSLVRLAAKLAEVEAQAILRQQHRRVYDLPMELLAGPGVNADRANDVTPPNVTVRAEA